MEWCFLSLGLVSAQCVYECHQVDAHRSAFYRGVYKSCINLTSSVLSAFPPSHSLSLLSISVCTPSDLPPPGICLPCRLNATWPAVASSVTTPVPPSWSPTSSSVSATRPSVSQSIKLYLYRTFQTNQVVRTVNDK